MKIAVKIDHKKIAKIKEKINQKEYLDKALGHLAYEIATKFYK